MVFGQVTNQRLVLLRPEVDAPAVADPQSSELTARPPGESLFPCAWIEHPLSK